MKITLLLAASLIISQPKQPVGTDNIPNGPNSTQQRTAAQEAAARFASEPTVQEIMEIAVKYNKITTENIKSLNRASNLRALLPTLSAQYGYGWHEDAGTLRDPTLGMDSLSSEKYGGWGVIIGGTWDLSTLAFNPAELQSYALHGMRNNLQKDIAKIYFARRQAVLQYFSQTADDQMARLTIAQKIEEFNALLDGYTGGYFTGEMQRRGLTALR